MRFAQIVMGPAGCGKSTYCSMMAKHAEATKRNIRIVNFDPAAEKFDYDPIYDVRELIQLEDVMGDEELKLGPNGGLIYCMEYILKNTGDLLEAIGEHLDGDYLIFDCPGQIELYTHMTFMKRFIQVLSGWGFRVCGIYTIDSHFLTDGTKFIAGALTALSAMLNVESPFISLLTKMDLLSKKDKKRIDSYLEPDPENILASTVETEWNSKFMKLTASLGRVLDNYNLIKFFPLDWRKEHNVENLLIMIDMTLGISEDAEVKTQDFGEEDDIPEETDEGLANALSSI